MIRTYLQDKLQTLCILSFVVFQSIDSVPLSIVGTDVIGLWVLDVLIYGCFTLLLVFILQREQKALVNDVRQTSTATLPPVVQWITIVLLPILSLMVYAAISGLVARIQGPSDHISKYQIMLSPLDGVLKEVAIIYLSLTAGLLEEFFYRRSIYQLTFRSAMRYRALGFIVISSMLFGFVHIDRGVAGLARATLFGVYIASAYLITRSFFAIVASHVLIDYVFFRIRP